MKSINYLNSKINKRGLINKKMSIEVKNSDNNHHLSNLS